MYSLPPFMGDCVAGLLVAATPALVSLLAQYGIAHWFDV